MRPPEVGGLATKILDGDRFGIDLHDPFLAILAVDEALPGQPTHSDVWTLSPRWSCNLESCFFRATGPVPTPGLVGLLERWYPDRDHRMAAIPSRKSEVNPRVSPEEEI